MEEFILSLDPNYRLDGCRIKDNTVVYEISSLLESVECPYCGEASSKVHSCYQREIQDLPMQNKKVILLVKNALDVVRKLCSGNRESRELRIWNVQSARILLL